MATIKVKLVRSLSGHPDDQVKTVLGLGLRKFGSERVLADLPQIRGMVAKVGHLIEWEKGTGEAPRKNRGAAVGPKAGTKVAAAAK
jgi:large subunit ribosomal protein L30